MNYRCDTLLFGEILAIISVITFVVSNGMYRKVEKIVSPSQINAFRTSIGAITFLFLTIILGEFQVLFSFPILLLMVLFISVILGQVIGDTAYFESQKHLGTTVALTISMTFPIFTFFFSALLLKTHIPNLFFVSTFLVTIGVLIIHYNKPTENSIDKKSSNDDLNMHRDKTILYILIGLLAAISWAIGIVFTEFSLNEVSTFTGNEASSTIIANAVRFPFAALILLFMSIDKENKNYKYVKSWEAKIWKWLFLGAILGTSIGALLYFEATRVAGAAFVSVIWISSPLFSLPISWFLNKEKINLNGFIGIMITTIGVILVLIETTI